MTGRRPLWWVDEVQPTVTQHGDWENPDERIQFHDQHLSVTMRNHLLRTVGTDGEGEHRCQAIACQGGWDDSPAVVGYALVDSGDDAGSERLDWHWTTVIEFSDGRILLVCEDCTPTNLYPTINTN